MASTDPQRNTPVPKTMAEFLEILDDIRNRVAAGDSWEGDLHYEMPDWTQPKGVDFMVSAMYRVDRNRGGYRQVGEWG